MRIAARAICATKSSSASDQRRSSSGTARRLLALGILVLVEVLFCGSARAGGHGDEGMPRDPQARLLSDEGHAHLLAHRFAQARDSLAKAAAVERAPATLLFLAEAEEKLRHFATAQALLRETMQIAPETSWRRAAEQRLTALAQPWGTLHVTHPPGATVTVDEVEEAAPNSVDVLPGFHVVRVDIGGRALTRRIEVAPGTGRALSFVDGDEAAAPEPTAERAEAAALGPRPSLRPQRFTVAPTIDGRLDDVAWRTATQSNAFVQHYPDEGKPPTEPTTISIGYDDTALYIAFDCTQRKGPVLEQLAPRDDGYLADAVEVDIDPAGDGRSAYLFSVNVSGVLADAQRADGIEPAYEWDERWEGAAVTSNRGFVIEIKIPLRALPIAADDVHSWGFQARRQVAHSGELDEWAFIPRAAAAEATAYGRLEGLRVKPASGFEVTPYALGGIRRTDATANNLRSGVRPELSAGLDARWRPAPAVSLSATVNPDFSEVRADSFVLNLTNTETYRTERRPFFVEGLALFADPNGKDDVPESIRTQLLYTRRIGALAPPPALRTTEGREIFDDTFRNPMVLGAAKAVVSTDSGLSYGVFSALVGRSSVETVLGGSRQRRLASPITSHSVARVAWRNDTFSVGATIGATARFEPRDSSLPTVVAADGTSSRLCPDGTSVPTDKRCFANAYVASADAALQLDERNYELRLQPLVSILEAGPDRVFRDGHVASSGDVGSGFRASFAKNGGDHVRFSTAYVFASPRLELNDLGFLTRQNVHYARGGVEYRTNDGTGVLRETRTSLFLRFAANAEPFPLQRSVGVAETLTSSGEHVATVSLEYLMARVDDREIGDGTALDRQDRVRASAFVATNPREVVSVSLSGAQEIMKRASSVDVTLAAQLRPSSNLVFELASSAALIDGEQRFRGVDPNGNFLFGALALRNVSVSLRTGLTFTPHLFLELYGQAFAVNGGFTELTDYEGPRGLGQRISLDALRRVPPTGPAVPFDDGALNAAVVLQWEYALGSTASIVASRSQSKAAERSTSSADIDFRSLPSGPAVDLVLLKLSYWLR